MNEEKKTQNALLETIDIMIKNKLKNLSFNYYVDGVIKKKNDDDTYNVLINGKIYNNISSKNNFEYSINDVVQILIKNGNWKKKFIDDIKNHNEIPKNIHNLGKRNRIRANDDFDNYTTIGSFSVRSDTDAKTISNIPMNTAGNLDVYSSNGNDIDVAQNKYLIQEYTVLTGSYKFIRHIRQTPNILADPETYPKGWEFREWRIDVNSYTLSNNTTIKNTLLDLIYPVGSIYMSVNNVSPQTFLGGTWTIWGEGRTVVGVNVGNSDDTDFGTVEKKAGARTHTLTTAQMPSHTHTQEGHYHTPSSNTSTQNYGFPIYKVGAGIGRDKVVTTSGTRHAFLGKVGATTADESGLNWNTRTSTQTPTINSTGGGSAHNNLQPYITCYMWKRIS